MAAREGFIKVTEPQKYGLKANDHVLSGVTNAYMVSFYHQLHCIKALQMQFVTSQMNSSGTTWDSNHANHCFSYLRQAAICGGDMTLEGLDEDVESGERGIHGWGTVHICRNWETILDWMHENAAT